MEDVLWYLLASSRGGNSRALILDALADQPENANQLADKLGLDYTTVRHHLDILVENNVLRRAGDGYGDIYLYTDQAAHNRKTIEEIIQTVTADQ
jgi:Bacterial regulatory protein, arsR family.